MKLFRKQVEPMVWSFYTKCGHMQRLSIGHGYSLEDETDKVQREHILSCKKNYPTSTTCDINFPAAVQIILTASRKLEEMVNEYTEEAQKLKALDE